MFLNFLLLAFVFCDELSLDFAANPLTVCTGSAAFILNLDSVVIDPYPIIKGQNISITAAGTLSQDVIQGATVSIQVSAGIPIFSQTVDLCEQGAKAGINCPVAKGPQRISQSQAIPKNTPSGTFGIKMSAQNPDGKVITCMQGKIKIV